VNNGSMTDQQTWFDKLIKSQNYSVLQKKPIAYFCIEYALSELLPTYAGGLGVLAGDYVRELADQHIPAVAVGLYYQSKYGELDVVREPSSSHLDTLTPQEQGVSPVLDTNGKPLVLKLPFPDHPLFVKAWVWNDKTVPVYLLDTNIQENTPEDRAIGNKLYDGDRQIRLKQEMVLGIGGFRLLEALGIAPSIYHLNEGHSALLYLELIRHEMQKRKIGFQEALPLASHHVVFTNHTLLPAGNEVYDNDLFTYLLSPYADEMGVSLSDIVPLGAIHDSHTFSFSLFALRLAGKINAVSVLHGKEAAKTWGDFPIESVTNGIHLPTWDKIEKSSGSNFKIEANTNEKHNNSQTLWQVHQENKRELLDFIQRKTGQVWSEDELLLGWARRMVRYKRPLALFGELERLLTLVRNPQRPIRIVMSGIAHYKDGEGKALMKSVQDMLEKYFPHTAVYLSEYNITVARLMVSGCDVWLNTPTVGFEACGTSGMKAGLNGVLPFSTKDGWVDEIDLSEVGWALDNDMIHDNILDILEQEIVPMYYSDHQKWEQYMSNCRLLIQKQFSATRMLQDYFEKMYLPILNSSSTHYFS